MKRTIITPDELKEYHEKVETERLEEEHKRICELADCLVDKFNAKAKDKKRPIIISFYKKTYDEQSVALFMEMVVTHYELERQWDMHAEVYMTFNEKIK